MLQSYFNETLKQKLLYSFIFCVCVCVFFIAGRLLTFIERYMRDVVAPLYANTHTESSATGFQTTHFRLVIIAIKKKCI